MLIAVPFIWFSLLFYYLYKRHHKIDIACYITLIYGISALFSLIMYAYGGMPSAIGSYKVSPIATFTYCGLLTLCILPFGIYSNVIISYIRPVSNAKFLKKLAWFCFLFFLLNTFMSLNSLIKVLTGDFGELRTAHYNGEDDVIWISNLPTILRYPVYYINIFMGSPWVLQFLGFYCIFIQKLPLKYGVLFLVSSIIGITRNLIAAGRSDVVYWLIGLGACYFFFKPLISGKMKLWGKYKYYVASLVVVFSFFIYSSTNSRFGERVGSGELTGAQAGFVDYAGQAFPYFCYFFDNFECPDPTLEIIFPYTYQFIGKSHGGVVGQQHYLSLISNYELGVFYTFIGQIAVTSSNHIAIVYCLIFIAFSFYFASHIRRKRIRLIDAYIYMVLASVLFLGLFSHYYGISSKSFSIVAFLVVLVLFVDRQKKSHEYYIR